MTDGSNPFGVTDETADMHPSAAPRVPEPGVALCLSGGGYRAMLFHVGSIWRLKELGVLAQLKRVSSVSGGSITAGVLGMAWNSLDLAAGPADNAFKTRFVQPICGLASQTIDASAIVGGVLDPFSSVSQRLTAGSRKHLFGDATLQDLPDGVRFVINAVNVQTAANWRFSKPYMGDYHVGLIPNPRLPLAVAVAASSAFPPYLSPLHLTLQHEDFLPDPKADLQKPPYTTDVVLSDGGGYDNLGLEPAFKRYDTLLVSDGGTKIAPEPAPHSDWARHSYRMIDVVDNQVRSLRKRILIDAYLDKSGNPLTCRKGAFWGIRTDIADYLLPDALNAECPHERSLLLAAVPTRLEAMADELRERLINWGYAVCDAAIRKHCSHLLTAAREAEFPYDRGL